MAVVVGRMQGSMMERGSEMLGRRRDREVSLIPQGREVKCRVKSKHWMVPGCLPAYCCVTLGKLVASSGLQRPWCEQEDRTRESKVPSSCHRFYPSPLS